MSEAKEGDHSAASGGKHEHPSSSGDLKQAELRRHPRFRAEDAGAQLYLKAS